MCQHVLTVTQIKKNIPTTTPQTQPTITQTLRFIPVASNKRSKLKSYRPQPVRKHNHNSRPSALDDTNLHGLLITVSICGVGCVSGDFSQTGQCTV